MQRQKQLTAQGYQAMIAKLESYKADIERISDASKRNTIARNATAILNSYGSQEFNSYADYKQWYDFFFAHKTF